MGNHCTNKTDNYAQSCACMKWCSPRQEDSSLLQGLAHHCSDCHDSQGNQWRSLRSCLDWKACWRWPGWAWLWWAVRGRILLTTTHPVHIWPFKSVSFKGTVQHKNTISVIIYSAFDCLKHFLGLLENVGNQIVESCHSFICRPTQMF